jgi:predicted HAD superfamily Cof-like phosphohydrolase
MNLYLEQVEEFHVAMDYRQPTPKAPTADVETIDLRLGLLEEELNELTRALTVDFSGVDALDALCDLQYVLSGAILALGYSQVFDKAFSLVHASNLAKLWTADEMAGAPSDLAFQKSPCGEGYIAIRADGKRIKPPSWTPPDLAQFV